MCQVYGPTPTVGCTKCGAGYYEGSPHKCKVFVPFETWDAELQANARQRYTGRNRLLAALHEATVAVAAWPKWKRYATWQEEFKYSVTV